MLHELEYTVKMHFVPGAKDPSRLFLSMGKTIDAFRRMDRMLARTAGREIRFEQTLVSFEAGSFITKIKELFEYDQTPSLSSEPPSGTGEYVRQSRRALLTVLKDTPQIEDIGPIEKVASQIEEIAQKQGIDKSLEYRPVRPMEIADSLADVAEPTHSLSKDEAITYEEEGGEQIQVPPESSVATNKIEEAIIHRQLTNTQEIILKIKRPDYLGEAMWDFKHGKNMLQAKILDSEWLNKFHTKEVHTGPGDSLEVSAIVTEDYDKHGNLVKAKVEIAKVKSIIPGDVDED